MICPPCAREADADQQQRTNLPDWPIAHDPAICRDAAIQPHGCTCQHGQRQAPKETT